MLFFLISNFDYNLRYIVICLMIVQSILIDVGAVFWFGPFISTSMPMTTRSQSKHLQISTEGHSFTKEMKDTGHFMELRDLMMRSRSSFGLLSSSFSF
jgi:hypothetical protein